MTASTDYPVEPVQRRAQRVVEKLGPALDELIRREVSASSGHSDWSGDVEPLVIRAFTQGLTGLIRQLIENADESDCRRPATALVRVLEPEPRQLLRRGTEACNVTIFPGFWRPDGTWRDSDLGPGGQDLADYIREVLEEAEGERRSVEVMMQNIHNGDLAGPRTYRRRDLAAGGEGELPIDEVAAERIRVRLQALRERAAGELEASGWRGAARNLRAGVAPDVIIERVKKASDYAAERRHAIPILVSVAEAIGELEGNGR
jgi:hypothetical protein